MSEPVGNLPRGDIPGNSHRAQAAKTAAPAPREKAEKLIEGTVKTRKAPWYKRFVRGMIADDAQTIGDFVLTDVLLPATKNLIYDIITKTTGKALFSNGMVGRGVGMGQPQSLRTKYDQMGSGDPRRQMTREARARHDFDNVILGDRQEAVMVVEALIARVDQYGAASVSDLYDLVGVTGSFADQKWGWTNLSDADIRQDREGFLLDLPKPEPLR